MKVNVEIDCSPEEARRFLGLPDITRANEVYVDMLADVMRGATSIEQMQELTKQFAPMGQMGLRFFQQMLESGANFPFPGNPGAKKG